MATTWLVPDRVEIPRPPSPVPRPPSDDESAERVEEVADDLPYRFDPR